MWKEEKKVKSLKNIFMVYLFYIIIFLTLYKIAITDVLTSLQKGFIINFIEHERGQLFCFSGKIISNCNYETE